MEELKQTIETIWLNDDDSDDVNDVYDEEGENATTKSTTETAETLMKMLDVDADGKISPEEFKNLENSHRRLKRVQARREAIRTHS